MTPPTATDQRRPVPAIDPRIRARRIAVQRDEGRRRLHRLGLVGAAVALVSGAVGLAMSPLLDVDHVVVVGAARVSPEEVERRAGVERGDPLVTVDAAGAASELRGLPWIDSVAVERSWPGTVRIVVVERTPVAALLHLDGQASLVDADGRVLAEVPADAADVLLVSGLGEPGPPGSQVGRGASGVLEVASRLPAALVPAAGALSVAEDGALSLELALEEGEEPALVLLGDDEQLPAKLTALATIVASVPLEGLSVLDLAVPSAPALTRR